MIETFIGYGYNLGGPGRWHLTGIAPGAPLRTPWYDETDPTHDFPDRALDQIISGTARVHLTLQQRNRIEAGDDRTRGVDDRQGGLGRGA
jgi:hypothetical protein